VLIMKTDLLTAEERRLDPYSARLPRFAWDGQRWGASARLRSRPGLLRIDRWNARLEGAYSEPALRRKLEGLGYDTAIRTYLPGSTLAAETFQDDRVESVVSGLLKVTLDGETGVLSTGDVIQIPRGTMRRLEVVGSSPVMVIEGWTAGQ
jgi:mannose-6-phosphate isomerase-like protein (cupin superfamily)